MDIELRPLRHLLAVARKRSFSAAARELRLSQPALSASLAQFEARIGGRLLERGRNGARLTPLGEVMVRRAELIEIQVARAKDEARLTTAGAEGPLNIAVTPVAAAYVLPRAVAMLKAERPAAAINISETVFEQAMRDLRSGLIDISLGPLGVYPSQDGVVEEHLSADRFCVIARAGSEAVRARQRTLRALARHQWVLPSDRSAYHRQLEALFIAGGVPWPSSAVLTNSMASIKSMVLHSDMIAIMPQQLVRLEVEAGLLEACALREAGVTRAIGMSYMAGRPLSPLAQRFTEILRSGEAAP